MLRSLTRLAVAPLKLLIGMGVVWGCDRLSEPASAAVEALFPGKSADELGRVIHNPAGRVTDGLRVQFLRTEREGSEYYGTFLITNEGPSAVAYDCYTDAPGSAALIRQRGTATRLGGGCATGLLLQPLQPGQAAVFYARIPDRKAAFAAGFDLLVMGEESAGSGRKTFWSDVVSPPYE